MDDGTDVRVGRNNKKGIFVKLFFILLAFTVYILLSEYNMFTANIFNCCRKAIQVATPRTILTLEVLGNAPSNKVSLIAAITVNDSDHNKIVGTKGIVSYAYTNDVKPGTISWTSVGLASDRTYAFCAVTYTTTKNKTYKEVITFYP